MSAKSDQKTINKCMLQTLNTLVENDCRVKRIEPFCDTSSGFSITLVGRFQYNPLAKISIYENETKRTFIFRVDPGNSKVYADDMFPEITFIYTYIGEITKIKNKAVDYYRENFGQLIRIISDHEENTFSLTVHNPEYKYPANGTKYERLSEGVDRITYRLDLDFEHYGITLPTKQIEAVKTFKFVGNIVDKGFDEPNSCESIPDPVNHPNHYEMVGPFESFDIIVESLGIDGARYFCQGNIIKYQMRYKQKNGEEDLKKRHWYSRMDQMLAKCKTIEDYYKLKESDF